MSNRKEAKELTGKFIFPLSKAREGNSEIEGGEYVQDSTGIKLAEGPKHNKGGIQVILQDGDRVLTDYDKIDDRLATKIKDNLGIRVSKRDTYSTVLDKYSKKIGLDKNIEEQTKLNQRILEQEDTVDEKTRLLNLQALSKKLDKTREEASSLESQQAELFEILFADQEKRKSFENLKKVFAEGGEKFQGGGQQPFFRILNAPGYQSDEELGLQHALTPGGSIYGNQMRNNAQGRLDHYRNTMPTLYNQNLDGGITHDSTLAWQNGYNTSLDNQLGDVRRVYGDDSDQYNDFKANAYDKYRFSDKNRVSGIDGRFGDRTSSRASFGWNSVPRQELQKLNDEGIHTFGQLKEKYPDLYSKYNTDQVSDSWNLAPASETSLARNPQTTASEITADINPRSIPIPRANSQEVLNNTENGEKAPAKTLSELNNNVHLFPDSGIQKPAGRLNHLKTQNTLRQISSPSQTSAEALKEINRQRLASNDNLRNLDPQSRALATLGLQGQVTDSIAKTESSVADTNARITQDNKMRNLQLSGNFERMQNASAMDYEQKTYQALANEQANWRNYFTDRATDQKLKWNAVNKLNANNALNTDVQYYNGRFNVRKGRLNPNLVGFLNTKEGQDMMAEMQANQRNKNRK